MAHDGFARAIDPIHTMSDGDSIFCIATGPSRPNLTAIGTLAAHVMSRAILNAVRNAETAYGLPCHAEMRERIKKGRPSPRLDRRPANLRPVERGALLCAPHLRVAGRLHRRSQHCGRGSSGPAHGMRRQGADGRGSPREGPQRSIPVAHGINGTGRAKPSDARATGRACALSRRALLGMKACCRENNPPLRAAWPTGPCVPQTPEAPSSRTPRPRGGVDRVAKAGNRDHEGPKDRPRWRNHPTLHGCPFAGS